MATTFPRTLDAPTERIGDDFWAWYGPKLDELDARNHEAHLAETAAERDEDYARCTFGEDDVEFEVIEAPISQAPNKCATCHELLVVACACPVDVMSSVGVW